MLLACAICSTAVGSSTKIPRSRLSEHVGGSRAFIAPSFSMLFGLAISSSAVGSGEAIRRSRKSMQVRVSVIFYACCASWWESVVFGRTTCSRVIPPFGHEIFLEWPLFPHRVRIFFKVEAFSHTDLSLGCHISKGGLNGLGSFLFFCGFCSLVCGTLVGLLTLDLGVLGL